jgi:hypothetical protein
LAAAAARAEAALLTFSSDNDGVNNAPPHVGHVDNESNDEDDDSSQLLGLPPSNDASSQGGGDPSNFGEGGGEGGRSPWSSFREECGNESGRKKTSGGDSPSFMLRESKNESGQKMKKGATAIPTKRAAMELTATSTSNTTTTTSLSNEEGEKDVSTCCICLEIPTYEELCTIKVCIHSFCFSCIERWADQENTCPLCKMRFHTIERVNRAPLSPKKRKGGGCGGDVAEGGGGRGGRSGGVGCGGARGGGACSGERNSKRVRNRDQRSDVHSFINPLEGIFGECSFK